MKKNAAMNPSYSGGTRDSRGNSKGTQKVRQKLPPLGTQIGDGRGRAPGPGDYAKTGDYHWPKATETVPDR